MSRYQLDMREGQAHVDVNNVNPAVPVGSSPTPSVGRLKRQLTCVLSCTFSFSCVVWVYKVTTVGICPLSFLLFELSYVVSTYNGRRKEFQ